MLMPRAEVRRSPCNNRAPNRSSASRAAIALLSMLHQKPARVVAASRFECDRLLQNSPDAREEPLDLGVRQPIDRPLRIDIRSIEGLVGVQVSDAGDNVLRQQQSLD